MILNWVSAALAIFDIVAEKRHRIRSPIATPCCSSTELLTFGSSACTLDGSLPPGAEGWEVATP